MQSETSDDAPATKRSPKVVRSPTKVNLL